MILCLNVTFTNTNYTYPRAKYKTKKFTDVSVNGKNLHRKNIKQALFYNRKHVMASLRYNAWNRIFLLENISNATLKLCN